MSSHTLNGKRVNYSLTNQYYMRIAIAVVHNNEKESLINVYKSMNKKVPKIINKVKNETLEKVEETKKRRLTAGRKKNFMFGYNAETYYGDQPTNVDKPRIIMKELEEKLINKLKEDQKNREQIEQDTIQQRYSPLWRAMGKNLLTSSNFKKSLYLESKYDLHE